MSDPAQRFAQLAEQMIGCRFRLHGRNPATGLDCIGLVVAALDRAGLEAPALPPYRLRQTRIAQFERLARTVGFAPVDTSAAMRGDLCLAAPGPAQWHLLIATGPDCFVHAHAGLRRVVAQPAPLAWPILRRWRLDCEKEPA